MFFPIFICLLSWKDINFVENYTVNEEILAYTVLFYFF